MRIFSTIFFKIQDCFFNIFKIQGNVEVLTLFDEVNFSFVCRKLATEFFVEAI